MTARRVIHAVAVGALVCAGIVAYAGLCWALVVTLSVGEWIAAAVFLGVVVWWVR